MSIKSDKWIRRQCSVPTHVLEFPDGSMKLHSCYEGEELPDNIIVHESRADDVVNWKPMIEPFQEDAVRSEFRDGEMIPVISYGVSSYGYDVRVGKDFKIFTNINSARVSPKNFDPRSYVDVDGSKEGYILIPPNGFALGHTIEYFRIPRDVLTICLGKSTYARCGIIVNVTPLEPEWEGQVVLEFSNTTNLPAEIYVGEGVAQFLFLQADEVCQTSYKDRGGKYQGQTGVTLPKA